MIGAIIGDIVGSRFEFGAAPQKGFELFTSDCSYTDDTICTIAIADAVLNERDYQESLLDWCRRYPDLWADMVGDSINGLTLTIPSLRIHLVMVLPCVSALLAGSSTSGRT